MRRKTEFKKLLEILESSGLFSVCHLLPARYVSDCHDLLKYTEFLIIALFCSVTDLSILC